MCPKDCVDNRQIELHDSVIGSGVFQGNSFQLRFAHAYVHQSKGIPGVNSGSGWSYRATLTIVNGRSEPTDVAWPLEILDGEYTLRGVVYSNMVPIPFEEEGDIELRLEGMDEKDNWTRVIISGTGVILKLDDNPTYVEEFRGKDT